MTTLNKDLAAIQLTQVIEQLKQDDSVLLQAYSEYSAENGYDSVYDNDDDSINMMFPNASDAIRSAFFGDYNHSHAYFTLNGYGNLQSFEYLDSDNCPIDISELAQWLISEDKLADYDITVTTLDDMLASIEDNITDDNVMLNKLGNFLMVDLDNDSYEDNVYDVMTELNNYSYVQIQEIITMLGIDYQ